MARLHDAAIASTLQCLLAAALAWFWLTLINAQRGALEAAVSAAPFLLSIGLSLTSQADRRQYVVRLLACSAMLPMVLMMWSSSQDAGSDAATSFGLTWAWIKNPWLYFSICSVIHILLFVAAVWWLAAVVTRVEAASGGARVNSAQLGLSLQALPGAGVPVDVTAGSLAGQWVLNIRLPTEEGRSHRVLLDIDDAGAEVRVRERLGLAGAAPSNEQEASMRSLGDAPFDPARPDAQRVSGRSIQTTMVDPEQLAAVRLDLWGGNLRLLDAAPTEPEAVVTLLCALVTRSGYAWQPVMGRVRG